MRTAIAWVALAGAAALLAGCGAGDRDASRAWRGEVVRVDGVEVVRNPGTPLFDASEVSVTRLWQAPSEADEAERGLWEGPVLVRVADDRVYILDGMAHRVYRIAGEDGRWTATLGRRGGGPGELERPYGFALVGSSLVVGNQGRASLERFAEDGEYVGSVHLDALAFGVETLDEKLLVNGLFGREGGWRLVDLEGGSEAFHWPARRDPLTADYPECARSSAAGAVALRIACYRPYIQVVAPDGDPVREIVIDQAPIPVEPAVVESAAAELRTRMLESGIPPALIDEQLRQLRERYRAYPRFRNVRADPRTGMLAIWEQPPAELGGGAASLHLVSDAGVYLARIEFAEAWKDFDVHDGRIYALTEDEATGLVGLAAYEVMTPPSPAP